MAYETNTIRDTDNNQAAISRSQIEEYKKLQKMMADFNRTLGPRKESIFQAAAEGIDFDEVSDLIEATGKEQLLVFGEVEGQNWNITLKPRVTKDKE